MVVIYHRSNEGVSMTAKRSSSSLFVFLSFFILSLLMIAPDASCEYPERPVTVYVGMAPGGATDLLIRALAPATGAALGKPLLVENKDGAGGAVALGLVATAKPDGYILFGGQNVSIIDTPLMQKVTFKPLKSFTPIAVLAASEHTALLVKSDAPWKTFKEFIDYAKKNPGKVKYSSAGIGSGMHVAMEVIAHKDGIIWVHVPYKGTAPSRTALLGGHVDACSSGIDWPPFVQSGQLRVLATHGEKRSPFFPNVPTLKELGYAFVSETVHSIVGPAGMSPDVVKKLEAAFKKGTESTEFKTAEGKLYLTPMFVGSKEYEQQLKDKWVRTEKMFKDMQIIKEAATQPY
jgi:tripartite-type tricarboxylate transporter receptor subunit TctC